MHSKIRIWTLALVVAWGWAAVAQADWLKPERIPADAKWLVHIDVDKAKSSEVVQAFCQECLAKWWGKAEKAGELQEHWGIDPKEMHSVTVYGVSEVPRQSVGIVEVKVDKEKFLDHLRKKELKLEEEDYKGTQIYTWEKCESKEEHEREEMREVGVAFFKPDVLVFASGERGLKSAIDVLTGDAPSLKDKESPLTAGAPAGTILLVRAVQVSEAKVPFPAMRLLDSFDYAVAENEGNWFKALRLNATSEDAAQKFETVLRGWVAAFQLRFHENPDLVKLLDNTQIKRDGKTVEVTFQAPAKQLAAEVPAICKMVKEHWKRHMAMCRRMWKAHEKHEKEEAEQHESY